MSSPPPLPVRDGVGPTRLRVPTTGPWAGIPGFLVARFDHLEPGDLHRRIEAGEIVGADGRAIAHDTPLGAHEFVWYHRDLPDETVLPYREEILYRDDHLVVVDKPHFLPTTPSGRFLRETALVRLRLRLGNDALTPIHRLDRETAGLVLFSARPDTRGAYQSMFERREVTKVYEAVSSRPAGWDPHHPTLGGRPLPLLHRDHIRSRRGELRVTVDPGLTANSETLVDVLAAGRGATGREVLHTILRPRTGRPHQLRVHLAALGVPILGDRRYPDLLPEAPDDPDLPLQLLARELEFTDPLMGAPRRFVTRRTLEHAPVISARNSGG
ncbi:pseudouridine synthase [Dietzia kunjamensis]|uniref:pseudouridine synthase n=1 Tax=Dietzia kunjamensis TaxID=322509 RepID=UPI002DBD638F|nr:pseudouridine synthase [Dietzia kunjamensis]MEB8324663.1 pseudouridine synthase [Dietzia kunjamensis]